MRGAAFVAFAVAGLAGLTLVSLSNQWWLVAVGAVCIAGAWFYTGGKRPYGYAGLGELAVFVFFGPVGVLGTLITQGAQPGALAVVAALAVGMLTSAVLVANNLRDIPTDEVAGKRTLAVLLGDTDTRRLYVALVAVPLLFSALAGLRSWPLLLGLLSAPLAVPLARLVLGGAAGRDLIPVLARTSLLLLAWSALTALGLGLGLVARPTARLTGSSAAARRPRATGCATRRAPSARRSRACASARSNRPRRPRKSTMDSGSATIRPTSTAINTGTPARTSTPATAVTSSIRASA